MQNKKSKVKFFTTRISIILFSLIFILASGEVFAQKKTKKKKKKSKKFEFVVGLSSTYDNNILKYSEKYLDRFHNNEDEGRFHIQTYDDIIIQPSLQSTYIFRIFKKYKSKINIDFSHKKYAMNDVKTWSSMSLGFRQYLKKKASFKISYGHIPNFYIRHFRDDDWVDVLGYTKETFKPMAFSKDSYDFWFQNTYFKNSRIKLSFSYFKYYYNEHFTEYDCFNLVYGIKLYQPLNKKIRLTLGYQFVSSDAQAFDEEFENKINSDDSDGSFKEDIFILGMNWKLPKLKKRSNDFNIEAKIMKRYFSSVHYLEDDPTHAGRVDDNIRVYLTYNLKLSKKTKLAVFYNWYLRNSDTSAEENKTYLSNEKDYFQNQLGLKLSYSFKL
ncbi:MAG: hypothetical protein HN704_15060 [Bacteroidetes bacterium]|nr:hypothetical protein [Bacteroidota bacterium]MBT6685823.1 hypothetical protein [Bacteroidota bacterium]MBT7143527.1 hypothetical protein [Bacteroidota bacterium]MBT7492917.1 hypothetical protein [Bacteroidota bacterium]